MPEVDALLSAPMKDQPGYMIKGSHMFVQVLESSFANRGI